jgi:hypothetical protein
VNRLLDKNCGEKKIFASAEVAQNSPKKKIINNQSKNKMALVQWKHSSVINLFIRSNLFYYNVVMVEVRYFELRHPKFLAQ